MNWSNLKNHPLTTLGGAVVGMGQAGLVTAAGVFMDTRNVTDPKLYATAAAVGAASFIVGALLKDPQKATAPEPERLNGAMSANAMNLAIKQAAGQMLLELMKKKAAATNAAPEAAEEAPTATV